MAVYLCLFTPHFYFRQRKMSLTYTYLFVCSFRVCSVWDIIYRAIFPLPHSAQWLWTQRGRHWSPDGASLVEDVGRRSFRPVDKWPEEVCEEKKQNGLCEVSNAHEMRKNCAVTCKVYLTDEEYQLGAPRSKVFYSGREGEGIEENPK